MSKFTKISPSIIAVDYKNKQILDNALQKLKEAKCELIHLDVMDGKFVKNQTFDHTFVEYIKDNTDFILDVHLMVEKPELVVDNYLNAGADILSVHYEATTNLKEILEKIKSRGCLSGVSIKIETPTKLLKPLLDENLIDLILVMSVEPGACGQEFDTRALEKITYFKKFYPKINVAVDGGVKVSNSSEIIKAGADVLVSGSEIFSSNDIYATIKALKKSK